jgi:hypothetical protein
MSALENTVRVSSENQTLILAGEPVPRRGVVAGARSFAYHDSQRPLTIIATPVDAPMLLESTSLSRDLVSPRSADRGNSHGAAGAYARTQQLAGGSARCAIIDTYA